MITISILAIASFPALLAFAVWYRNHSPSAKAWEEIQRELDEVVESERAYPSSKTLFRLSKISQRSREDWLWPSRVLFYALHGVCRNLTRRREQETTPQTLATNRALTDCLRDSLEAVNCGDVEGLSRAVARLLFWAGERLYPKEEPMLSLAQRGDLCRHIKQLAREVCQDSFYRSTVRFLGKWYQPILESRDYEAYAFILYLQIHAVPLARFYRLNLAKRHPRLLGRVSKRFARCADSLRDGSIVLTMRSITPLLDLSSRVGRMGKEAWEKAGNGRAKVWS